jgi:tetratricopeptide (TPR) repeat protein
MARNKKITTKQLIDLIDEYAFNHPKEKITISALSSYICEKGFDVAAYLIRRDKEAREHINQLNSKTDEERPRTVITYHQLDIENFLRINGTQESMRVSLAQWDAYYSSIAKAAAKLLEENNKLQASVQNYRRINEELQAKLDQTIQATEAIKERDSAIKRLKKILDHYVYPEAANQYLAKEGILDTVNKVICAENLKAITIEPTTDISKCTSLSVEDLMRDFDE